MDRLANLKAIAFILNGAVLLIGIARSQGRLAPPDTIYVGLLLAAPLVSWVALVLGFRKRVDAEVVATAKAAAVILNALVLLFVVWLTMHLAKETLEEEGMWIALLYVTPVANALAILPAGSRGRAT